MSTITIAANFTKNSGQPATGLALSDIALTLTSQNKLDGTVTEIWNGTQNPTEEVTGCGTYTRRYTSADLQTYDYYAVAQYTGATALDANYITGASEGPTDIADTLLDRTNGIETSWTLRQALRIMLASLAGKLSGAATTTITVRDVNDTANRITAIVDSDGNRSSVTLVNS